MPTTLITGGAGFIGSHLAEHLVARGERVVVLDDLSSGRLENLSALAGAPGLEVVRGSVAGEPVVAELVERSDRVFHLAAGVGVRLLATDPVGVIETNVVGTATVLHACARYRRPVLFTSSSEVYGKAAPLPSPETADVRLGSTADPRWAYACSKAVGEYLALAHFRTSRLPVVVVRLFNVAGPRQTGRHGMVIPRFILQALSGHPITVYGDGTQSRCFIHVDDVVPALSRLLDTERAHGQVVNLGGTARITVRALARLIRELCGSPSEIVSVPFQSAYDLDLEDVQDRQPDLARVEALTGYAPRRSLADILHDSVAYWRARLPAAPLTPAGGDGARLEASTGCRAELSGRVAVTRADRRPREGGRGR